MKFPVINYIFGEKVAEVATSPAFLPVEP